MCTALGYCHQRLPASGCDDSAHRGPSTRDGSSRPRGYPIYPTAFTGPAVAVSVAPLVARQAPADCLASALSGIVALATLGLNAPLPLMCSPDGSGRYLFLLGAAGLGGCTALAHEIATPVRRALSPAQCRRFPPHTPRQAP